MKLSLAILMLITPSEQVKVEKLPKIPVNGQQIVKGLIAGLKQVPIKEMMHDERKECESDWNHDVKPGSPQDKCWTYERGLRRELKHFFEDTEEAFNDAGVELQTYDEEFITDLIEAEYADAVKKIEGAAEPLAHMIDNGISELTKKLEGAGLAQVSSTDDKKDHEGPDDRCPNPMPADRDCWNQWDCQFNPKLREFEKKHSNGPSGKISHEDWDKFYDGVRDEENNFFVTCFSNKSKAAKEAVTQLGSTDDVVKEMQKVIKNVLKDLKTGKPKEDMEKDFEELNTTLESEAKRLGLAVPEGAIPDGKHMADAINTFLTKMGKKLLNDKDGQRELREAAGDMRRDLAKEVYRMDRDLKELKGKDFTRELDEVSQGLSHMGVNVSAADLNKFATGMIEDAESALNNGIITKNLP